jgi:cytochrome c553
MGSVDGEVGAGASPGAGAKNDVSGPSGGGAGGSGAGATDVSFDTIYPIFVANCSGQLCHGAGSEFFDHPLFASLDPAESEAAATAAIDDILDRTSRPADAEGFMPDDAMPLSDQDKAAIQAWADSLR